MPLFLLLCSSEKSLPLSSLHPPVRQLRIARRPLPSLLFSRLKRPSSLSLSFYVMFSGPLIITGFAPVCPSPSCIEFPKVDTAIRIQSYKDQIEKKSPSPGGWPLLLQRHAADSARGAPGLPSLFLHSCFPASCPVFLHGLMTNWRHLPWVMRFLLAHFSVLSRSLGIAALLSGISGYIPG